MGWRPRQLSENESKQNSVKGFVLTYPQYLCGYRGGCTHTRSSRLPLMDWLATGADYSTETCSNSGRHQPRFPAVLFLPNFYLEIIIQGKWSQIFVLFTTTTTAIGWNFCLMTRFVVFVLFFVFRHRLGTQFHVLYISVIICLTTIKDMHRVPFIVIFPHLFVTNDQ